MSTFILILVIAFLSVMINRLNKSGDVISKKQISNIRNGNVAETRFKTSISESKISTIKEVETNLVRPEMSEKNKWLYRTNEFGTMEKGVVD